MVRAIDRFKGDNRFKVKRFKNLRFSETDTETNFSSEESKQVDSARASRPRNNRRSKGNRFKGDRKGEFCKSDHIRDADRFRGDRYKSDREEIGRQREDHEKIGRFQNGRIESVHLKTDDRFRSHHLIDEIGSDCVRGNGRSKGDNIRSDRVESNLVGSDSVRDDRVSSGVPKTKRAYLDSSQLSEIEKDVRRPLKRNYLKSKASSDALVRGGHPDNEHARGDQLKLLNIKAGCTDSANSLPEKSMEKYKAQPDRRLAPRKQSRARSRTLSPVKSQKSANQEGLVRSGPAISGIASNQPSGDPGSRLLPPKKSESYASSVSSEGLRKKPAFFGSCDCYGLGCLIALTVIKLFLIGWSIDEEPLQPTVKILEHITLYAIY
ncbi:hypothetical protein BIW11_03819 [Tropilaelaps mercedesae]|uniref:Uncharacterized protein n=1 Tax=Tropilaelaps mercedesae TaxID=418985 RepID=A0A1V9XFK7_9ACAR|nr:hypothetical protein BIW11_03819 [Tropilaelaps mercedesae]